MFGIFTRNQEGEFLHALLEHIALNRCLLSIARKPSYSSSRTSICSAASLPGTSQALSDQAVAAAAAKPFLS